MSIKKLLMASATLVAFTFGSGAHAISQAECLNTDIVNFDGTVVDAALATPALSTLVDAVVAAGLVDALNDAEDITVYAPTNDAFAAIPSDILSAILADTDVLTAVLTYHVSPGRSDPRRFVNPQREATLQGQRVFYNRYELESRVNNAVVECQGVRASNGLVWLIGGVLLPSF